MKIESIYNTDCIYIYIYISKIFLKKVITITTKCLIQFCIQKPQRHIYRKMFGPYYNTGYPYLDMCTENKVSRYIWN